MTVWEINSLAILLDRSKQTFNHLLIANKLATSLQISFSVLCNVKHIVFFDSSNALVDLLEIDLQLLEYALTSSFVCKSLDSRVFLLVKIEVD